MISRFGPNDYDNYFGELSKLRQSGSVQDYLEQFETLLSKTNGLPVDCDFVSGLKGSIVEVDIRNPENLVEATILAKKYERKHLNLKRLCFNWDKKKTSSVGFGETNKVGTEVDHNKLQKGEGPADKNMKIPQIKKLSFTELKDRKTNRLCHNCNEKYFPRHECQKLFIIRIVRDDDTDGIPITETVDEPIDGSEISQCY